MECAAGGHAWVVCGNRCGVVHVRGTGKVQVGSMSVTSSSQQGVITHTHAVMVAVSTIYRWHAVTEWGVCQGTRCQSRCMSGSNTGRQWRNGTRLESQGVLGASMKGGGDGVDGRGCLVQYNPHACDKTV